MILSDRKNEKRMKREIFHAECVVIAFDRYVMRILFISVFCFISCHADRYTSIKNVVYISTVRMEMDKTRAAWIKNKDIMLQIQIRDAHNTLTYTLCVNRTRNAKIQFKRDMN